LRDSSCGGGHPSDHDGQFGCGELVTDLPSSTFAFVLRRSISSSKSLVPKMSKFLLTVCAFGLLLSSASAQDWTKEEKVQNWEGEQHDPSNDPDLSPHAEHFSPGTISTL